MVSWRQKVYQTEGIKILNIAHQTLNWHVTYFLKVSTSLKLYTIYKLENYKEKFILAKRFGLRKVQTIIIFWVLLKLAWAWSWFSFSIYNTDNTLFFEKDIDFSYIAILPLISWSYRWQPKVSPLNLVLNETITVSFIDKSFSEELSGFELSTELLGF